MSEDTQWFLRAITKDGKKFITDCPQPVAILGFKAIYDAATGGILPTYEHIPNTWRTEIFLQFTDPTGIVAKIDLCQNVFKDETLVLNSMWFESDREGRTKLITSCPVSIVYTFADAVKFLDGDLHALTLEQIGSLHKHEMYHDMFRKHETSQDFHMGYFDPSKDLVENMRIKVSKSREPGDNSGVFEFAPVKITDLPDALEETDIGDFFAIHGDVPDEEDDGMGDWPIHCSGHCMDPDEPSISVGDIHNHSDDIYSAPAMDQTEYRIYINGRPTRDIINDISWMQTIVGMTNINDVQGFMEMPQWLYEMLDRFLRLRDFKIGAHPIGEILEDGNDAGYSLFWGPNEEYIIRITPDTPERDRDEGVFNFDDVNY